MLRCYLQATADMAGNELAGIFLRTFVSVRVLALVQQQVIAYTAANEGLLDAGQGIYGMIDVEQRTASSRPFMRYILADGPPKSLK